MEALVRLYDMLVEREDASAKEPPPPPIMRRRAPKHRAVETSASDPRHGYEQMQPNRVASYILVLVKQSETRNNSHKSGSEWIYTGREFTIKPRFK
jgi:hypothetical protein